MGNSQGSSNGGTTASGTTAGLIIQYPNGRTEKMKWSLTAGELMQMNPGHFVSLIMQMNHHNNNHNNNSANNDSMLLNFTRLKLLRPHESLVLGSVYRLLTTQEVMKVMRAKKINGKMKTNNNNNNNNQFEGINRTQNEIKKQGLIDDDKKAKFAGARSKSWRPSLHSISEASA